MELFRNLLEPMSWWQLLLLSFVLSFTLFFSMREFLSWYLKVHDLKTEIKKLMIRIDDLEALIRESKSEPLANQNALQMVDQKKDDSEEPSIDFNLNEKPSVNQFPIDH